LSIEGAGEITGGTPQQLSRRGGFVEGSGELHPPLEG
jgi:hypothetical protein